MPRRMTSALGLNLEISRRDALLALGAFLTMPALTLGAGKTTTTKDKDKEKDKEKDKTKAKDKGKVKKPSGGGKYGGWGGQVTGGEGHATVKVRTAKELEAACRKGNATILIEAKELAIDKCIIVSAPNITIDGQGCTLRGDKIPPRGGSHVLHFQNGKNYVVKNLRIRNGPDNLSFKGCKDIAIVHVSSTGAGDDGISVGFGCENVTISHCFVAGCARAIFCKYNENSKYTIDHNWIMKLWERAPLLYVKDFDVRNNMIQEWVLWATRPYADSAGNIMGNLYLCPPGSKGKKTSALQYSASMDKFHGKSFIKDNVFRNCSGPLTKGTVDQPIDAPAIVPAYTSDMKALEKMLTSNSSGAGCMPRDAIDKAFIELKDFHVSHDGGHCIPPRGEALAK